MKKSSSKTWPSQVSLLALLGVAILGSYLIFMIPFAKGIPPGTDALTYINDADYIQATGSIPRPYQVTVADGRAYVSPLPSLFVVGIANLINTSPLEAFPIAEKLAIIFLLGTTALLLVEIDLIAAILGLSLTMTGYGLMRLVTGSNLANLLAFSLINLLLLIGYRYAKGHLSQTITLAIGIMLFVVLFFTHKYLSFPIVAGYALAHGYITWYQTHTSPRERVITNLAGLGAFLALCLLLRAPLREFIDSFFVQTADSFIYPVPTNDLPRLLSWPIVISAIAGAISYLKWRTDYDQPTRRLISWIGGLSLLLLLIPGLYYLGIYFYYERIIFLANLFLILWAALALTPALKRFQLYFVADAIQADGSRQVIFEPNRWSGLVALAAILITSWSLGFERQTWLFSVSNAVRPEHIGAFAYLRDNLPKNAHFLGNQSVISLTTHDKILARRPINYFSTDPIELEGRILRNHIFDAGTLEAKELPVEPGEVPYLLLVKDDAFDSGLIDTLFRQIRKSGCCTILFDNNTVRIIKMNK